MPDEVFDLDAMLSRRNSGAVEAALRAVNKQVYQMTVALTVVANQQATLANQFAELQRQVLAMQVSRMTHGPTA